MTAQPNTGALLSPRRRIHFALEALTPGDPLSVFAHRILIALVVVSVGAMVLESVPRYAAQWRTLFITIEVVAVVAFTIEYALRLWSAPDATPYAELHAWEARKRFALTPLAIIDLLSIMPLYFAMFLPIDLRVLLIFRLLRFFKLARYSPGMRSLVAALEAERKALAASMVVLLGAVLVAASAMHLVEGDAQPDKFGTIPDSMWWAVITLTTVGYGDVYPITLLGRIVAGLTALTGFLMLALPVGIVATAFAEEIHKREFVVTWGMLARVPLFSNLSASEIAELMPYLRAQTVESESMVLRRGDDARSLYFIAEGAVALDMPGGPTRLSQGQFFGEAALLRKTSCSADVRALEPTKLLLLDAADVFALMSRNDDIRQRIENVARLRADVAPENEIWR